MTTLFTRIPFGRWYRRSKAATLELHTPHVPLGYALELGVSLLQAEGCEFVGMEDEGAQIFHAPEEAFAVTVHAADGMVSSVVYDDPAGRTSEQGKAEKIKLYLARYGTSSNWELRMHNDWMHYWFNPADKVAMVYGLDMDVLRFNRYEGE